jgi:hypothetical protein
MTRSEQVLKKRGPPSRKDRSRGQMRSHIPSRALYATLGMGESHEWAYLLDPISDPATGEAVYPSKEPFHFLDLLPQVISGSYIVLLPMHDAAVCPFAHSTDLPMVSKTSGRV